MFQHFVLPISPLGRKKEEEEEDFGTCIGRLVFLAITCQPDDLEATALLVTRQQPQEKLERQTYFIHINTPKWSSSLLDVVQDHQHEITDATPFLLGILYYLGTCFAIVFVCSPCCFVFPLFCVFVFNSKT